MDYLFYSLSYNKTFVHTNTRFVEEDYVKNMEPRNWRFLEKLLDEKSTTPHEEIVPRPMIRVAPAEAEPATPRRSGRVVRQLDRYGCSILKP